MRLLTNDIWNHIYFRLDTLGICASTAIFSVVHTVLLKPLSFVVSCSQPNTGNGAKRRLTFSSPVRRNSKSNLPRIRPVPDHADLASEKLARQAFLCERQKRTTHSETTISTDSFQRLIRNLSDLVQSFVYESLLFSYYRVGHAMKSDSGRSIHDPLLAEWHVRKKLFAI
jgi:hypothetical protein